MSRILKVHLAVESPNLVHEFRNFGEDVYRALRDEYKVSIEEIDASTKEFHVQEIPRREVRAAAARIRNLAARYSNRTIQIDEPSSAQDG